MTKHSQSEQTIRRHAALEQSLLTLLRTHSLQEISVKDICQAAAIPRRTFYHYFTGKEDLTDTLLQDLLLSCDLAVMPDFSADQEGMRRWLLSFFRFWQDEHLEDLDLLLKNGMAPQMIRLALQWVQREYLQPRRKHREDAQQHTLAVATVTGFFSLLFYWVQTGCHEPAEQMAELALRFFSRPVWPL